YSMKAVDNFSIHHQSTANARAHDHTEHDACPGEFFPDNSHPCLGKCKTVRIIGDEYVETKKFLEVLLHGLTVHAFGVAALHGTLTRIKRPRCSDPKSLRPIAHLRLHHPHQQVNLAEDVCITILRARCHAIPERYVF